MDSGHGKTRMKVEGDRLSNLPDDVIHKILSFIGIKQAIETSALSSRWRYVWTSMPYLNFSSNDFRSLPEFSKFVTHVLSARNNQTEVHSVNLAFRGKVSQVFVRRILDYAFSHNVQQLKITCLSGKKMEFPLSLFNSPSLKHLTLIGNNYRDAILTPSTWELPNLVTLKIYIFTLNADDTDKCLDLFSNCANLKSLTLYHCRLRGLNGFNIFHPGLSSLTLNSLGHNGCLCVNVVTPQLKYLSVRHWQGVLSISAPNLSSLHYKDNYGLFEFSADFLRLKKVDICVSHISTNKEYAHTIVRLLQQIHSVEFLTLSLEAIKLLSQFVELISHLPSPFANLKRLKIYPEYVTPEAEDQTEQEVTMCTEVKNYLLDASPGATVTMVSHDEIRAVMNVQSARSLMRELQELLDEWKENSEANTAHMKQDKAPIESHMSTVHEQGEVEDHKAQPDTKMEGRSGGRMTHITCYWEDLNEQFKKGNEKTGHILSMLQKIEGVLTKLPTSHRAKLQERFFGLSAEAEALMDDVMDCMKIQYDKKPSRSKCLLS
ncbi:putative F-box domain, leucine-rich repeat domain superfamily, F-box-like domain superfamily [Helianthus annuus]|nr:putative F-box domain, leucine-rich repeat domain superfamily, F-box-like domain superfamily [Helianthus annuus]KAJ0811466.1 putative F-box domain, leucine-rich repeat domain superfamily, F-box-like domain superfamily [Helianthus annuus]